MHSVARASESEEVSFYIHYVYILQSEKDNSYYTGYTIDITERLKAHNQSSVDYTASRQP